MFALLIKRSDECCQSIHQASSHQFSPAEWLEILWNRRPFFAFFSSAHSICRFVDGRVELAINSINKPNWVNWVNWVNSVNYPKNVELVRKLRIFSNASFLVEQLNSLNSFLKFDLKPIRWICSLNLCENWRESPDLELERGPVWSSNEVDNFNAKRCTDQGLNNVNIVNKPKSIHLSVLHWRFFRSSAFRNFYLQRFTFG